MTMARHIFPKAGIHIRAGLRRLATNTAIPLLKRIAGLKDQLSPAVINSHLVVDELTATKAGAEGIIKAIMIRRKGIGEAYAIRKQVIAVVSGNGCAVISNATGIVGSLHQHSTISVNSCFKGR